MRGGRVATIVAAVATLAAAGLVWQANEKSSAATSAQLARGAAVYAEACASCHGANLEGQPDWRREHS